MASLADTIHEIPFFSGLAREDLARVVGKLEENRFSQGAVVLKQGSPGDALFVVQSGGVEVLLEHDGAGAESVALLGPGECFGEMALFSGERRSATVRVLVDSVILKLSKENWEELIADHPSLSLHFCNVLSRRLAETNKDIFKGRGAFNMVMEEFFSAQSPQLRDFLIRSSILKRLDRGVIESVLIFPDPDPVLTTLSSSYPGFLRTVAPGCYEYREYLRGFLSAKFKQTVGQEECEQLHRRSGSYFSSRSEWLLAIHHYAQAGAWQEALGLIRTHGEELLNEKPAAEVLAVLDLIPVDVARPHESIAKLRAEIYFRLGELDAAIRTYQDFLSHKQTSAAEAIEMARYYQELAELHQKKGEISEALGCLRLGASVVEENRANLQVVEALRSVERLQHNRGRQQAMLEWGRRALHVAERLMSERGKLTLPWSKGGVGLILAIIAGWIIWQMEPVPPLDARGVQFVATLTAAVIMWMFEVFDEYITALLLLISWLLFEIASPPVVLGGFSKSSWFFVLGVLGMGAAVTHSGLLYRVALQVLHRTPWNYRLYTSIFAASGIVVTPLMPMSKGRLAIILPVAQAISETVGFKERSNGFAGLALSAFTGYSQMNFIFLTGATVCLVGWNLLPGAVRAEFGWGTWALAALPAGFFTLLFLYVAIILLYRIDDKDQLPLSAKSLEAQLEILGPLTKSEWLSIGVLIMALIGWVGKPFHGIDESWVALCAFIVFLTTGVLDKNALKRSIDWGFLLFFGVISSMGVLLHQLAVDNYLVGVFAPILSFVSFHPLAFLITIALIVYVVRIFLRKIPTVVLLMLTLMPAAQKIGIHPGVLLITMILAIEAWFLPYQTDSYQIAYYGTNEKAFSHAQARKLMIAKFISSLIAIAISIPYWRMLGFLP